MDMQIFATLSDDGAVRGYYTPGLHGSDIPADAIEITIEQHEALLGAGTRGRLVDGEIITVPAPVIAPRRIVSRSDFLGRLTGDERRAVVAASAEDMDVSLWQVRLAGWKSLDLDGDATRAMIDTWRSAGAITRARATAILK